MTEDTKKLLQIFYVDLRESLNALEISRAVYGLSQFDLEQIESRQRNDGNMLAVDRLVDTVGRRSIRTFVSFVDSLKRYGHHELVCSIIQEANIHYPNIYRSLSLPTATITPLRPEHVRNQSQLSQRLMPPSAENNSTVRQDQTYALTSTSVAEDKTTTPQFQHRDDSGSEDGSPELLTLDTKLNWIEHEDFIQWTTELNKNNQWETLATKMKLKFQHVADLEKEDNPSRALFRRHCCDLSIKRFMIYLTKANLTTVLNMVQERLGNNLNQNDMPNALSAEHSTIKDSHQLNNPVVFEQSNIPSNSLIQNKLENISRENTSPDFNESITDNSKITDLDMQVHKITNIGSANNEKHDISVTGHTVNISFSYGLSAAENIVTERQENGNPVSKSERHDLDNNDAEQVLAVQSERTTDQLKVGPDSSLDINQSGNGSTENGDLAGKPVITEPENTFNSFEKPPEKACDDLMYAVGNLASEQEFVNIQSSN